MDAQYLVGATAMADAIVAATRFGSDLYPQNAVCVEDERVSEVVRFVLDDGNEAYPLELAVGHTHLLIGPQARAVPPGLRSTDVDGIARACAPAYAVCDYCSGPVAPVAGLLPVPAGASVPVLCLCESCTTFLADTFPSAHFVGLES